MPFSYGLVPLLGGLAILVGGTAALLVDRWDLLANVHAPRPILVRYTSQATYDLTKWPHWIFVMACSTYAPCLILTAKWQAILAESEQVEKALEFHATLCAVGGLFVAILPMGNAIGTILHMIAAGMFASFGINYMFQVWTLAQERDETVLVTIRLALACLGLTGVAIMIPSVYGAVTATSALEKHAQLVQKQEKTATAQQQQDEEGLLTPDQCRRHRWNETMLAVGQITVAVTMALILLTAIVEVGEVENNNEDDSSLWLGGGLAALGSVSLTVIFGLANKFFYRTCQAPPELAEEFEDDIDTPQDADSVAAN